MRDAHLHIVSGNSAKVKNRRLDKALGAVYDQSKSRVNRIIKPIGVEGEE